MANKSYYDSTTFINAVKRQAAIPTYQGTFTDDDILQLANEEIDISVVPSITEVHEDYFLASLEIDLIPGVVSYDIPYRASGNKLRDVAFKDANSNIYEMKRVPVEYLSDYRFGNAVRSIAEFYYVQNNQITLLPGIENANGKLLFFYYFRPNRLVQNKEAGVITAIDTVLFTVTLDNLPPTFTNGVTIDMVQERNPHKTIDFDLPITAVNNTTKTLTFASLPSTLRVGDHVALSEQTIIPQIPSEIHPMLVERVVFRIMAAQGDAQGMQASSGKLAEMEVKAGKILDNRVEGSPQKIVVRNGFTARFRSGYVGRRPR
jgi:hypothetical protein